MGKENETVQTIAMAEYALDLGIPIVKFLMRLRLAESEDNAEQLITASQVFINSECFNSLETVITTKHIEPEAIVKAGDKKIRVIKWIDGDSLR
jgi:tyrosyl-tRNA synthetase